MVICKVKGFKMKTDLTGVLGTGLVFLPQYQYEAVLCMEVLTKFIRQEGLELIKYQDITDGSPALEAISDTCETVIAQVFIKANLKKEVFEQKLGMIQKLAEQQIHDSKLKHRQSFSIGALSTRVIRKAS